MRCSRQLEHNKAKKHCVKHYTKVDLWSAYSQLPSERTRTKTNLNTKRPWKATNQNRIQNLCKHWMKHSFRHWPTFISHEKQRPFCFWSKYLRGSCTSIWSSSLRSYTMFNGNMMPCTSEEPQLVRQFWAGLSVERSSHHVGQLVGVLARRWHANGSLQRHISNGVKWMWYIRFLDGQTWSLRTSTVKTLNVPASCSTYAWACTCISGRRQWSNRTCRTGCCSVWAPQSLDLRSERRWRSRTWKTVEARSLILSHTNSTKDCATL